MKAFSESYYQRPHAANLKRQLRRLIRRFKAAKSQSEMRLSLNEFSRYLKEYEEMRKLAIIRSHRPNDRFYHQELLFYESMDEEMKGLEKEFHEAFLASDFELDPDKTEEVAAGQKAVFLRRIHGRYLDESLAYEAAFQKRHRARLKRLRSTCHGARSKPEMYERLLNPETTERYSAWEKLDLALQHEQIEAAEDYLNFIRLRCKMAEYANYEGVYEYSALRGRLRFDRRSSRERFKQLFAEHFLPIHDSFRQLLKKRYNEESDRVEDALLLLPSPFLKELPRFEEGDLPQLLKSIDQRLGADQLFFDLQQKGYCQSLEEFQATFPKHPVSFPASGSVVLFFPELAGRYFLNVIESIFSECGKALLLYSTLKNYPGVDPQDEAPGAEAMAALGLILLFTREDSLPQKPKDEPGSSSFELLSDLLLGRYLYLLPRHLLVADFEEAVYAHPEIEAQDFLRLWLELREQYYPALDVQGLEGFTKGFEWQLFASLFTQPFSSLEEPFALATLLAEQPWRCRAREFEQKFNQFLLANRNLRFDQRLEAAGFKSPWDPAFFPQAAFSIMDRLEL